MKYSKGKDKQRQIKIRRNQKKTNKKHKTVKMKKRKVIGVIGICVLILNGELYRVSLEILLHDFCAFRIFYIVSSLVKLCQNS